jgi:hypothetical protein
MPLKKSIPKIGANIGTITGILLKDRYEQKQFNFIWGPGIENLGDYSTKHHTGSHHSVVRPIYLYVKDISPSTLQGCVELLAR